MIELTKENCDAEVREEKVLPVVVDFFATWCGPCVSEIPDLQKISKEYAD